MIELTEAERELFVEAMRLLRECDQKLCQVHASLAERGEGEVGGKLSEIRLTSLVDAHRGSWEWLKEVSS